MTPRSLSSPFVLIAVVFASAVANAQLSTRAIPSAWRGAQELASGWLALAGGRAAEAERVSDAMLKAAPRSHEALALKIRARLVGPGVAAALDAYEGWLPSARQREDAFQLEPIAVALIESLVGASDSGVRTRALELLAGSGDQKAAEQLGALTTSTGTTALQSDAALARLGDPAAVQRLAERVKVAGTRDVSDAIDVLREGRVTSAAGIIAGALDPARPMPTKMAAARALGALGDPSFIPRLKEALKDPDPPVRAMAAVALARLGDDSTAELMRTYASSPVGDLRLIAFEGGASGNRTGPWVAVATGVLRDPDPLVRLRAAELLLQHAAEPGAAADVFAQALGDSNPAMRHAAAQRLDRLPPGAIDRDLPTLRKLLRDPAPEVRLEAAGAILRLSGALP